MQGVVNVTRITEAVRPDSSGNLVRQLQVEFKVGEHGPFVQFFPAETTQAMQIRMKLDEFARTIDTITG